MHPELREYFGRIDSIAKKADQLSESAKPLQSNVERLKHERRHVRGVSLNLITKRDDCDECTEKIRVISPSDLTSRPKAIPTSKRLQMISDELSQQDREIKCLLGVKRLRLLSKIAAVESRMYRDLAEKDRIVLHEGLPDIQESDSSSSEASSNEQS